MEKRSVSKLCDVAIIGGGSAEIAAAASLLKPSAGLDIAIIDPTDVHYHEPGSTMVGAGVFAAEFTRRSEKSVMPRAAEWIKKAATGFAPQQKSVTLDEGSAVACCVLLACPGINLDWGAIEGLDETLGKNGVAPNYSYDLATYTNRLVKDMLSWLLKDTIPPPIYWHGMLKGREWIVKSHKIGAA